MIKEQTVLSQHSTENTAFKMEEVRIKDANDFNFHVTVTSRPMGNCQVMSIGFFCNLLYYAITPEDVKKFVSKYAEKFERKLLLIDLNLSYVEKAKKIYPEMTTFPYTSSNGSEMVMCLIRVR